MSEKSILKEQLTFCQHEKAESDRLKMELISRVDKLETTVKKQEKRIKELEMRS